MTCVGVECSTGSSDFDFSKSLDLIARDNWDDYLVSLFNLPSLNFFFYLELTSFTCRDYKFKFMLINSYCLSFYTWKSIKLFIFLKVSMGIKSVEDNRIVNCFLPSKFLYYISNDAMLIMKSNHTDLKKIITSYLSSFPTLVFTMVNLVKCTKWANIQCFQQYFNGLN